MTTAGLINTAARPRAERIIDGDQYHVSLDLDALADTLIDQIAAVIHRERRTWQLSMVGNPRTRPAERAAYRRELRAALILARAFDVPVNHAQAEELQADLFEATVEPGWCDCDEEYATRPDGLGDNCGAAADLAHRSCVCGVGPWETILGGQPYGVCASCGKYRAWNKEPQPWGDEARRLLASIPAGERDRAKSAEASRLWRAQRDAERAS